MWGYGGPFVRLWASPILAWLAALALMAAAAGAAGSDPFTAASWAHSDSAHYEAIAEHGYRLHRCAATGWCGNTAWFPGYSLLVAAVHAPGVPIHTAGLVVSWL